MYGHAVTHGIQPLNCKIQDQDNSEYRYERWAYSTTQKNR